MGRKSKYDEYIKPHLNQIREWKKTGATDEKIAAALCVALSSYSEYKKKYPELAEANKSGVANLVMDLRGELAKNAFRHKLETKKVYQKKDVATGKLTQYTEITTKEVDGDIAAINLLLKNLDRDWSNDPQNLELRRQELELRKEIAKANNFDLELK